MRKNRPTDAAARDTIAAVWGAVESLSGGLVRPPKRRETGDQLVFGTVYTPSSRIGSRVATQMGRGFRSLSTPDTRGLNEPPPRARGAENTGQAVQPRRMNPGDADTQ
jgi:hypothetical protein